MHEQTPTLTVEKRERLGSRYSKRLREQGRLPAIVYGHGQTPEPVVLNAKEALTHFGKGERLFMLSLGDKQETVLLKELQYDHLGDGVVHADFTRVNLTERVKVRVMVRLLGDAKGLKAAGAILMHPVNELEIECLVSNMPEHLDVDISELDVNEAIHAGDITLPLDTMKLASDSHGVVAQIVVQQAAKTAEEEEVAAGEGAEPEVITEKKDEEGAAEG